MRKFFLFLFFLGGLTGFPATAEEVLTPQEHIRGSEQTYLTFPEWFLVHSPAEYAEFLQENNPSDFPYFGHIDQFWQSYGAVYDITKDKYPFNFGYHVMVSVIGTSTTVEYGLKSSYETLFGRLTEISRTGGMTQEDKLAARIAQDYVDFIRVIPWYEFDFLGALRELWTETGFWGKDNIRKWERKYALTTEYGAKAIYGWVIKKLTKMGYEPPLPVTVAVVDHYPQKIETDFPEVTLVKRLEANRAIITLPRYDAFKNHSMALAKAGVEFEEIAGNRSKIVISILVPCEWKGEKYNALMVQPILTRPDIKRVVLTVPVAALGKTLLALNQPDIELEHIYDF